MYMTDYLSTRPAASAPDFWAGVWSSFKTWLHAARAHRKLQSCNGLSREAVLANGERVNMSRYRIDGTTFVVETDNGATRRIPASLIVDVEDRGDWGYT